DASPGGVASRRVRRKKQRAIGLHDWHGWIPFDGAHQMIPARTGIPHSDRQARTQLALQDDVVSPRPGLLDVIVKHAQCERTGRGIRWKHRRREWSRR